ncbi:uncharacterized protein LOC123873644 isoform X2 [Maniola jurtina]|uniref:uncharacterized protein LOC123873644 isoform X2 n=1 Tax=Maniola jurtina TaxID=191418 RepID=UPI001E689C7F|nr:uncharacterized protein LOC123873644 isoform X2 [Maniola jurtina]
MTLKVLIIFCVVFFLGKAQEVSKQPGSFMDEKLMNLGPSTIHSIKGKFYEEKQRENDTKPKTYNANVTKLDPVANIGSILHNILTNNAEHNNFNNDLPRQGEKIIFRRNKSSSNNNDLREPMPQTTNSQNSFKSDFPKKLQKTQINNSDPSMILHTEHLVSSHDKNNSIETIKKELVFDSLSIKNDFNNYGMSPTNDVMNSFVGQEINPEADIVHRPITMRLDEPGRRFETNPYYQPILNDPFKVPIMNENNNTPLPITPKFEQTNYDKSTCYDRDSDEILERSGNEIQLVKEPTKGLGISNVGKARVMLIDHPRVCYACSSISDLSCWAPDRTTSVKYCRADHPSCLTKLYKYRGLSYIIRDCGKTCEQNSLAIDSTKYTACTICHHDLCNSAHHFEIQNITILILLISHLLILLNVAIN